MLLDLFRRYVEKYNIEYINVNSIKNINDLRESPSLELIKLRLRSYVHCDLKNRKV